MIIIPSAKAKTHSRRFAYLPDWMVEKIKRNYNLERMHPDAYFISSGLRPGENRIGTREIDKYWTKMRDRISLPKNLQLYSYRDTGINMLEEQGIARKVIIKLTDQDGWKIYSSTITGIN